MRWLIAATTDRIWASRKSMLVVMQGDKDECPKSNVTEKEE